LRVLWEEVPRRGAIARQAIAKVMQDEYTMASGIEFESVLTTMSEYPCAIATSVTIKPPVVHKNEGKS
jgi:hypothetical protein